MWLDFQQFCDQHGLLQSSDAVLLAMSGGADSMVLGHLLLKSKMKFEVAHCNFQLRGEASDKDADFVEEWAQTSGVRCHVQKFSLGASGSSRSIQQEAREVRYQWFFELMKAHSYSKLLTAHHATDNVETLFINLLRGAGAHGWSGIPLDEKDIVRPLLFASKQQILDFARTERIGFRDDESNESDRYLRNRIRHHILPAFSEINPGFEVSISRNQMQLRDSVGLLEALVQSQNSAIITKKDDRLEILFRQLQPNEFAADVLYVLLRESGFRLEQCQQMLDSEQSGSKFYSASHEGLVDRDRLIVRPLGAEMVSEQTVEIFPEETEIQSPVHLKFEKLSNENFKIPADSNMAALDYDRLEFPLALRKWREGDRFKPLGMDQHKLISDFLIDEKVNRFDKAAVLVLESAGEIIWLVGYRIAQPVRITENTSRIFRITCPS